MKYFLSFTLILTLHQYAFSQAKITESLKSYRTYDYSDPNPVVKMSKIYPYFSYDGYETTPSDKKWKVIELENKYIKVLMAPEIGGKILGAIDKGNGNEFLYYNKTVKFRKIAMRGPWTSGGLEFNFGTIGHTPMVATPVDYTTRENNDGSVSCFIAADDLQPGTRWTVEVRLPPDKAYFEVFSYWHNSSELETSLYHWTNAAAAASKDLRYYYPGNQYIDHGGKPFSYPIDLEGRDLSLYGNNTFGGNKSLHILGNYTNYFGGYYEDKEYGFVHWANYSDKPGKKLWMWATSRQGAIWEDLLTDSDLGNGQYIEYQSGLLFNQAAGNSSSTPFKHLGFLPNNTEYFREIFYPVRDIGSITYANEVAAFGLNRSRDKSELILNPIVNIEDTLYFYSGSRLVKKEFINLKPLEQQKIKFGDKDNLRIQLGDYLIDWSEDEKEDTELWRPTEAGEFDWESAYGLYMMGREKSKQRLYTAAQNLYEKSLMKDSTFIPSLEELVELHYRRMNYDLALDIVLKVLSYDTYSAKANYFLGQIALKQGDLHNALDGFGLASKDLQYKAVSLREISRIFIQKKQYDKALEYSEKSLRFDALSSSSQWLKLLSLRLQGETDKASEYARELVSNNPLDPFIRAESIFAEGGNQRNQLTDYILNEFAAETFLNVSLEYFKLDRNNEAIKILEWGPDSLINQLWKGYLLVKTAKKQMGMKLIEEGLKRDPFLTFPYRVETLEMLEEIGESIENWKIEYFKGLIHWSKSNLEEAKEIFIDMGNEPDFAPFYLTRTYLLEDNSEYNSKEDIDRALELNPKSWRANKMLVRYLIEKERSREAVVVARDAFERTENMYLEFELARGLLADKKYQNCYDILQDLVVLPYEGASEGRVIFQKAALMSALEEIKAKNFKQAVSYARFSKEWPENLGVGKPYKVDEIVEDYVLSKALAGNRNKKEASRLMNKITDKEYDFGTSLKHQVWLLTLYEEDKKKMDSVLKLWEAESGGNEKLELIKRIVKGINIDSEEVNKHNLETLVTLRAL